METITSFLVVLAGLLLRLAIPIAGTIVLVYFLRWLDASWQAEAKQPAAQKAECWKVKGCSEEQHKNCSAASSPLPCWQCLRQPNGYLQEKCLSCSVFAKAPIPR